ncbi:MAG: 6-bladed beta-propeller, partial [Lachnoclostridium sp.]|nr:6-bladed beta-propeller [Lachnoclostridium sp.]
MIKRRFILPALIALSAFGCKRSVQAVEMDFPTFNPLTITQEVTDLRDYIEAVELIPLISESPIYFDGKKMIVLDGGDLIFLTSSSILRFDKVGNLLFTFGRHGRGPGEYIRIYDI